jgi:hypothetical protein
VTAGPEEITQVLRQVVCREGLAPVRLVKRYDELGPIATLRCVDVAADGPGADERTRAVVAVIRDAVHRLGDGPTRTAAALLLGIGSTRGMLRKDRRRAAARQLGVSDEHFRKHRERRLLAEVADEIWAIERGTGPEPTALIPEPGAPPLVPGDLTEFIADVTVPDGSTFRTGETFTKIWEFRNAGTVPWVGRMMERVGPHDEPGLFRSPWRVPLPDTRPGERVRVEVELTAPNWPGTTRADFKMIDADGQYCFPGLSGIYCIAIIVP